MPQSGDWWSQTTASRMLCACGCFPYYQCSEERRATPPSYDQFLKLGTVQQDWEEGFVVRIATIGHKVEMQASQATHLLQVLKMAWPD